MRARIVAAVAVAGLLLAYAFVAPGLRRRFIQDVISWDAEPSEPIELAAGVGPGLPPAPRTRVILIDGLAADVANTLPTWSAMCKQGLALTVDVGFPTVSLPVQVSLWSGLTQQQTGIVFRSDRPLSPPWPKSIPSQVPGSRAVAENHGYIVRSIGFASALPDAAPDNPSKDRDPDVWATQWQAVALEAIASDAPLAFVHVLRVDTAGHRKGRASEDYRRAARESDEILAKLVAAAPDARWFLLSDHGHLATGGHGGEERDVRQVEHCIVGPGIFPGVGAGPSSMSGSDSGRTATTGAASPPATKLGADDSGPTATAGAASPPTSSVGADDSARSATGPPKLVHLVDISRALADSVGASLDRASLGRPLSIAQRAPLERDQAVPPLALGTGVLAIFVLALGVASTVWSVRRWWLAPWWFVLAGVLLILLRGVPTLSTPMIYAGPGDAMRETWEPALIIAAAMTYLGLGHTTLLRVLAAQLTLPLAALAAAITACGAWPTMFGAEVAPIVPHYTAFVSPLLLVTAHGAAAIALAVLARTVHSAFDQRARRETPRTAS